MEITNKLGFLLVVVAVIVADVVASPLNVVEVVKIGPKIDVSISELADDFSLEDNGPGIVTGLKSCGGPGTLFQMLYEPCSGEPGQICKVPGDNIMRRAEIHFAPSEDIESLAVRILGSTLGIPPTVIFDKRVENSGVRLGSKYVINADVGVIPMFRGRTLTLRFELYREYDKTVEICSTASFKVV